MEDRELRRLASTPVGRRWVLKVGGAALLAALLGGRSLPVAGATEREPAGNRAERRAAVKPKPKPRKAKWGRRVRRDVYIALPKVKGFRNLTLRVAGQDYPVRRLTAAEKRALKRKGGLYGVMDTRRLTHTVPKVLLSTSVPSLLIVLGERKRDGRQGVVAERISAPRAAATRVARAGIRAAGSPWKLYEDAAWRKHLGVGKRKRHALNRLRPADFAELDVLMDPMSTGVGLVYMHPEVMNLDDVGSSQTVQVLNTVGEIDTLTTSIANMYASDRLPYWNDPVIDPKTNKQAYLYDADGNVILDGDDPALAWSFTVNPQLGGYSAAVGAAIAAVKDDTDLEGSTYYVTPTDAPPPPVQSSAPAPAPGATALNVELSRSGWNWGAQVTAGDFDPATRELPLKIYNNWERMLAVHVQYFADKDDMLPVDNHDADPNGNSSWRSTDNSEYLTYVSDMPEQFGVPWALDANYSEAAITLPKDANYARLLLCGPGAVGNGSQWRDFMPVDQYADRNFPIECQWPLISTFVFDFGIPAIMLGFDAAIAGGDAVNSYKRAVSYTATAVQSVCRDALNGFDAFGDMGAYLQNKEAQPSVGPAAALGEMATIIPTMLWGNNYQDANYQLWGQAALLVTEMIIQWAAVKAIPVLGQVFGAIAALGDLAQMMQTVTEMSIAPWVIDYDVRITYAPTITLQKDLNDSTFPKGSGGAKYTVHAIVDGSDQTRAKTGAIPDLQQDDITITDFPNVPISKTIQYTLQIVDGNGTVIGTGASAVLPNNDTTNLPSQITIVTQEQEKPLTSQTTFVRQDTLQFDATLGKYHWAQNVPVTATRTTTGTDFEELDLASVGTVSGMLGTIWRDGTGKYRVRNTPSVEKRDAVTKAPLGVLQQLAGPYPRRPYLVYDRLNPDPVDGNNFFLEPQTDGGFLVRRLTLGADGGQLGWPANQAWGYFPQDINAVTYHHAGFIVAVHSATGRLHVLRLPSAPVADDKYPTMSQVHAGTGDRPGLTQNPAGVCVALDGTIILLETGANRMQAFDIGGNPVEYFAASGGKKSAQRTLHGSSGDTRLGIGVDGVGYIYVLSYSGSGVNSGSSPNNYRVDIYSPDGTWIVGPTGVNVATFDVDYWRNLFALNYATLTLTDGTTPYTDPSLGRTQPSVSILIPSTPA